VEWCASKALTTENVGGMSHKDLDDGHDMTESHMWRGGVDNLHGEACVDICSEDGSMVDNGEAYGLNV
jgi:hypothetical protein